MNVAKDCLLAVSTFIYLSHVFYRIIWLIRLANLAHWCFLLYSYPRNPHPTNKYSVICFVSLLTAGVIPSICSPSLRNYVTILSMLPQLHLLLLLYNVHCNINNRSTANLTPLMKTLNLYTAVSLVSVIWTVINVIQSNIKI